MKYLLLLFTITISIAQTEDNSVRDYYKYDFNDFESLEMELNFGLGELNIHPNDKPKIVSGTIEYNPNHTEIDIDFNSNNKKASLSISGEIADFECCDDGFSFDNFEFNDKTHNMMDFKLATGIPTELELGFGLGEAYINLTDMSLSYFELDCGLSDVKLELESSNKISCERVSISSGLGDFNGYGLGNINTRKFNFDVGLGSATIDLRGKFQEDMDLSIDVGLGSLELILPKNVNIKLRVDYSFLSSVDVDGLMSNGMNKYISREWIDDRPTIIGNISVGLGSIDVEID
ncbi:MAG: hypothetical protein HOB40_08850 [Candidatus Marinimicrobia bacterium]|jgi:hypothetical protein|nr:hypothetical protein [Candidatus Neomarinimicrobiota bacterium]MBT3501217.1 hypothetical protein [Candidatus Neomarinimicrobiota bacterium]MBT3839498.1 hypothetical protein [Candidatus Neomarinimicrobiota bacterium]MBT3999399.1 hypothetical protein [Candidatus Neomarinimicrobiota bacterium]MBT4282517.1 hypothetical protein [Candidatus Neomarinimicrobiota bacterium]